MRFDVQFLSGFGGQAVGFRVGWVSACAYIFGPTADGVRDGLAQVRVLAHEARQFSERETDEVMKDQNLYVAVQASADSYGRNLNAISYQLCYLARDKFKND